MSKRMMGLLAALLAVALAIVFDPPPEHEVVGAAQRKERPVKVLFAAAPARVNVEGPIPDLFAGAGQQGPATLAQNEDKPPVDGEPAAPLFSLMGFKEEDGVREAYLLHGGAVLVARPGAVLEKRYRVKTVGADAVHITDTQSGDTLRIGYGEEE